MRPPVALARKLQTQQTQQTQQTRGGADMRVADGRRDFSSDANGLLEYQVEEFARRLSARRCGCFPCERTGCGVCLRVLGGVPCVSGVVCRAWTGGGCGPPGLFLKNEIASKKEGYSTSYTLDPPLREPHVKRYAPPF